MKKFIAICSLILIVSGLKAQTYGNEWINYSQKYYKIKIARDGIFRIDSVTLASAGIPVNTIDPHSFQIFNKGTEQYIYVQGENDNAFNGTDYIEFYGQKNVGDLDSAVYVNTPFVPNPYYSLFNDTASYFLTWNSSAGNKRMSIEADTAFSSYSPANYFFKEEIQSFHSGYYYGETDGVGGTDSRYTKAEGWFDGNVIDMGVSHNYTNLLNTSNAYSLGPDALIKTVVVGASRNLQLVIQNLPDHHLMVEYKGSGSFLPLIDTSFIGYELNQITRSIPPSSLGSSFTDFKFTSIADPGFTSNRTAVSYIYVKYPHTFDLEGKNNFEMFLPDNGLQSKSLLNINNFSSAGTVCLFDLTNHKRINVVQAGSNYKALVPNGDEKKCLIISESAISYINILQPVSASAQFTDFSAAAADSAYVIITNKALLSSVVDYKNYRNSNIYGGFHNVVLADIDELYDQFAYGIFKSPLSIKKFSKYLLNTYPSKPQDLFLIGKSIQAALCRNDAANYANCLVPTWGYPSSDNLLTGDLNNSGLAPSIPTGRLSARNITDVDEYLNKIQQYENRFVNPPSEWMKYVMHFGGGTNISEQTTLRNYLDNYKRTIQDTLYGGTVIKEIFKTSSAPIEINSFDKLKDLINGGVSLMTLFGHASANSFDQSIDQITTFNPIPGHYPFMLSNGCYSGNIHDVTNSSSEDYVLFPNKGLIGFLGSVGIGLSSSLNVFSEEFYHQIALTNYGNGVGSSIQRTINNIQSFAVTDPYVKQVCYEMTLEGDPAIKLNAHEKPDYKITNNDVYFDVTRIDSFTVFVARTNIGKATGDTIVTEVTNILPNGDTLRYASKNIAPLFKDTISFKIRIDPTRSIGLNKIKVKLDALSEIDELNEDNNETSPDIILQINAGTIDPVYPYQFAIIPTNTVTLKASTADLFAPSKKYIMQIDTTDTFGSPLGTTIITSSGGVIQWTPPITLTDSTVYYWRVSPDSINASSGYFWKESSFQYINGKRGWEQAHFFQFKNDAYQYVNFNRPQRKWNFVNDLKFIRCVDGIYPYFKWTNIVWELNSVQKTYWTCLQTNSGFNFAVFDPVSGNNWQSTVPSGSTCSSCHNGPYGNSQCRDYAMNTFDFLDGDSLDRSYITNFINIIPNGSYVLAYSLNHPKIFQYESSLINAFQSLGAQDITTVPSDRSYILFGRKGNSIGNSKEIIADSLTSAIQLDTLLTTNWNQGFITSPVIGPAQNWGSLHWRQHTLDGASTNDSIAVRVTGIKQDGTETILADFPKDSIDVLDLASYVNASVYPNIRLTAYMQDDILHSPPQMERWQVIYTPVPEAAINPIAGYYNPEDTLAEGDNLKIHLPIQNISDFPFTQDSLLVTYWIEDASSVRHNLPSKLKKKPFNAGEILIDTITVNTVGYHGRNALWVEVNPVGQSRSQLEQYHFNNIVSIPFYTSVDRINPLLDVTFDGVHILNNDIVSAKPNVLIQLKDENKFLALNDTNDFKIFIKSPSSALAKRVYFGNEMSFIPAVLPKNSCKINYTPTLFEDGTYQMLVQAKDKSSNESGDVDYKINFEVINKSTITEVMNYPNPFTTATRFVFTITGSEIPSNFKVQIMTITGKVVREIFQDELGSIHIGRNITEYAWDGRDEFGDQLANGVYLYRVTSKINGEDIEKRATEADQYFKKGWGKMYLMR